MDLNGRCGWKSKAGRAFTPRGRPSRVTDGMRILFAAYEAIQGHLTPVQPVKASMADLGVLNRRIMDTSMNLGARGSSRDAPNRGSSKSRCRDHANDRRSERFRGGPGQGPVPCRGAALEQPQRPCPMPALPGPERDVVPGDGERPTLAIPSPLKAPRKWSRAIATATRTQADPLNMRTGCSVKPDLRRRGYGHAPPPTSSASHRSEQQTCTGAERDRR